MPTRVVNIYKEPYDIYIGRSGQNKDGTFGNPFNSGDRNKDIESYKTYFYKKIKEDNVFKMKILKLQGKRLGCFCKPKKCHGDIIADYLDAIGEPKTYGIIGCRRYSNSNKVFDDYEFVKEILSYYNFKKIISGGAIGADSLAKRYWKENNINFEEIKPNWNKHKSKYKAAYVRNKAIVDKSDEIIAFWDSQSTGTRMTINIAYEQGKLVHIYWPKVDSVENLLSQIG